MPEGVNNAGNIESLGSVVTDSHLPVQGLAPQQKFTSDPVSSCCVTKPLQLNFFTKTFR